MRTFYKVLSFFKLPLHKQALLASDIPKSVLESFDKSFPEGQEHQWYTRLGMFIVNFKNDDHLSQIYLSNKGEIVRNYRKVTVDEVPQPIADSLSKMIPLHAILEVLIDDTKTSRGPLYRLTYIKDKQHVESEYDAQGNALMKDQL